eukprot:5498871-Pleurochrysis_carterae.AAC.1
MPLASVTTVTTPSSRRSGNATFGASGTPSLLPTRSVATSRSSVHSRTAVPPGFSALQSSPRFQPLAPPLPGGCATA